MIVWWAVVVIGVMGVAVGSCVGMLWRDFQNGQRLLDP